MAASPLASRVRLATTIKELRKGQDLSAEKLAAMAGLTRVQVSHIETAERKPDPVRVMKVLEALGISSKNPETRDQFNTLLDIVRNANETGWWESREFKGISERLRIYADVESAATWIGQYHNCLLPGVLQTEGYIAAREKALAAEGRELNPVYGAARLRRQQEILRPGGPKVEVILEEQAVRRLTAPPDVMAAQLRHLVNILDKHPQVSILVLPIECSFEDGRVPRTPMALHRFEDGADGIAVLIELVDDDLYLDPDQVDAYVHLFERMRGLALSQEDSTRFIEKAAKTMAAR